MSGPEVLERRVRLSRLYDLYAPLLTERQRRVYELHELDDLSLSEISQELSISRQGVSDQLTRARDRLEELEKLLGMADAFSRIGAEAQAILKGGDARKCADRIIDVCEGRTMTDV